MKIEEKTILWKPVSEYTGGRVLATNGLDILIGELNPEGDCVSEDCSGIHLCGITHFAKIDGFFPELKESEDERIRKAIVATIHLYYGESLEDEAKEMIAWLEKQGEQNPANKVEPKFKVGDWIVNNTTLNLCHIVKVEHGQYICDDCSFPITKENEYHLWTIQDAKDGDVLVTWNNTTFIFKAIEDDVVKYYIAYNEKWDEEIRVPLSNDSHVGLAESQFEFKPATKEQRDTLMKAMADAEYTFEFEKKELKKIEKKSTDNDMKEALRTEYEKGKADAIAEIEMQKLVDCTDCTNSKGCINCKDGNMKETLVRKPAWSEEDEMNLKRLMLYLSCRENITPEVKSKYMDWLKSLKDRVQSTSFVYEIL